MTLYEVIEAIENCVKVSETEAVDTSTGEIVDINYLEQLPIERDLKIENCIKFYKNLQSDAESYKKEAQRLQKLQKSAENKAAQMKAYLGFCLNGEKFKSNDGLHQVSFRRSESIDITDLWSVPDDFLKYKDPEPDKTAIKNAIKSGQKVAGAVLVEKQNVSIK